MSDFHTAWQLCRGRFEASLENLSPAQLNAASPNGWHTIGQIAVHVAGAEVWMARNIMGEAYQDELEKRIAHSVRDSFLNEEPFPFPEVTRQLVDEALRLGKRLIEPILLNPPAEFMTNQFESPLGPIIDGRGALARMAFHPAYHHGQIYFLTTSPDFPA